jgi:hypothetical protein
MKSLHDEAPVQAFTFVQQTIQFKKDGSTDTSTWYEAIHYPDEFRIDFGSPNSGNSVLYRKDSVYRFREGKLLGSRYEPHEFLLLEGGLYHYELDEIMERMTQIGLDTSILRTSRFNGQEVYILGAKAGDHHSPQIWLHMERLHPLKRIMKSQNEVHIEAFFSDFVNHRGDWIEQKIDFYIDEELAQTEYYNQLDVDPEIPEGFFDPKRFGQAHWFSEE